MDLAAAEAVAVAALAAEAAEEWAEVAEADLAEDPADTAITDRCSADLCSVAGDTDGAMAIMAEVPDFTEAAASADCWEF